jgi:hypothetical protein
MGADGGQLGVLLESALRNPFVKLDWLEKAAKLTDRARS